jgi:type III secretion protein C
MTDPTEFAGRHPPLKGLGTALGPFLRRTVAIVCLCSAFAAQAATVPWPEAPYSYFADNQKLESVLSDFAGSFSLSLSLAPGATGTVSGKFTTGTPTEFISKLAGVYGFVWYSYAGTLFISKSSDLVTRTIVPPGGSMANLQKALTNLGVLDSRFGWGELPGQGVALVSGPASYVKLIEETVRGLPAGGSGALEAMVFRLRNASAEDRSITYRDREIQIPGLATILRNLITGQGNGGFTTSAISALAAPLQTANNTPTDLNGGSGGNAASRTGDSSANRSSGDQPGTPKGRDSNINQESSFASRLRTPTVQADPRLNALIIQDMPDRMPIYKRLIEQLDIPAALIEIEAMIIDVNTERAKDLGINWGARSGGTAIGYGALLPTPSAGTLSVVRSASGSAVNPSTLIVDAGSYLVSQIRLLETTGDASIQSRPSVITMDNVGALLDLSETFYIRVQGERVATVTPVTAGTTLKVTPRALLDGDDQMVQLTIDIEDGQIQDRRIDSLPTVRRSSVSTQALVRSNDTLLIAGHTQDQNINSLQKVPVLGDIPVFGTLFSNKSATVQRRERLFMIKPRIISLPVNKGMGETVVKPPAALAVPEVASPPLFMLNLGTFEPSVAAVVGDRVRMALGAAGRRVKLLREGETATVLMGPFESQDLALTASQKMDLLMNLNISVVPIPEAGF